MSDLPLARAWTTALRAGSDLATLPTGRDQTWRLGEAMRLMLRADGVAITLEYLSDNRVTLCASDEVAAALESLQEVLGRAPGTRLPGTTSWSWADLDGDADQRWPMLAQTLEAKFGPLRVYAVPLARQRRAGRSRNASHQPRPVTGRAARPCGVPGQRRRRGPGDGCCGACRAWGGTPAVGRGVELSQPGPPGHRDGDGPGPCHVQRTPWRCCADTPTHWQPTSTTWLRASSSRSINFSNFDVEGD